jgi:hypothetical protein
LPPKAQAAQPQCYLDSIQVPLFDARPPQGPASTRLVPGRFRLIVFDGETSGRIAPQFIERISQATDIIIMIMILKIIN